MTAISGLCLFSLRCNSEAFPVKTLPLWDPFRLAWYSHILLLLTPYMIIWFCTSAHIWGIRRWQQQQPLCHSERTGCDTMRGNPSSILSRLNHVLWNPRSNSLLLSSRESWSVYDLECTWFLWEWIQRRPRSTPDTELITTVTSCRLLHFVPGFTV